MVSGAIFYPIEFFTNRKYIIGKNIFACLLSVHNTISLLRHEQVC